MAQTRARSRSQQPPPPKGQQRPRATRRKPGAPPAAFDPDVIILSDDEANQPKKKKARTVGRDASEVILAEVNPPRNAGPSGVPRQEGAREDANATRVVKIDLSLEGDAQLKAVNVPVDIPEVAKVADPVDHYLSLVLEVVPDIDPEHAMSLIRQNLTAFGEGVVQHILHHLLENPTYPKIDKKSKKRKRDDSPSSSSNPALACNYANIKRDFAGGANYFTMALNQLLTDFPFVPKGYVEEILQQCNRFYAPAHLLLLEQSKLAKQPFKRKASATRVNNKGKRYDPEFERERQWLQGKLAECEASGELLRPFGLDEEAEGGGIACGCCFDDCSFDDMVQCPEAHLFCKECMKSYVSTLLGQHDPKICCMDQSGCKALFPESELSRFLDVKLLSLYHRVKQIKEIEAAGLEGLEECPFCEYKVVIDNPDEKLFRCENDECGVVSCRGCKKAEHLPKSCEEAETDKGLDARHKVEEAMTEALKRDCPKCKKPFVKEAGCNKMTCPHCRTLSCYVCRKEVKGYDHFDQRTPDQIGAGAGSSRNKKCPLWEDLAQRHATEVEQARNKAIDVVRGENPGVDAKTLEVDVPKTAPAGNAAPAGLLGILGLPGVRHDMLLLQHQQAMQQGFQRVVHEAQVHDHAPVVGDRIANIRQFRERQQINPPRRLQILLANRRLHDLPPVRPARAQPVQPMPPIQPFQIMPPGPLVHRHAFLGYGDAQPLPNLHININANFLPPNAHVMINHNLNNRPPNGVLADAQLANANLHQRLAAFAQAPVVVPPAPVQPARVLQRRRRQVR